MKKAKVYQSGVYYKEHKESREAIVFVHGILEGPKQFRKLAEIGFKEGYSVYMLLLPGHGRSSKAFANTNYMEWVRYVSRQINLLLERYDEIIIVGHSMGALLAICERARRNKGIKALFLINTPLKIHVWPRVIKGAIKIKLGKMEPDERYVMAEYHAISVGLLRLSDLWGWMRRYSELLSIIKFTKRQIQKINIPIFLVFAAKDEFVNLKSYNCFKEQTGKRQVLYLQDSGHFCYHHSDLVILEKAYTNFIREQKNEVRKRGKENEKA